MACFIRSSPPVGPYLAATPPPGDWAPAEGPSRALPEARRSSWTWVARLSGDPAAEIPPFPQPPALWRPASRHNTPGYPTPASCRLIISEKWRRVAIKTLWKFPVSCLFSAPKLAVQVRTCSQFRARTHSSVNQNAQRVFADNFLEVFIKANMLFI